MTDSLTYAVGESKVNAASQKLCSELQISKIEIASEEELRDGGFTGSKAGTVADVRTGEVTSLLNVIPVADRKPHMLHSSFFQRLGNNSATDLTSELMRCVKAIEGDVKLADKDFKSPLTSASLKSWGAYANKRVRISPLYVKLESWYEALRILVVSWEEAEDLCIMFLRMMKVDSDVLHYSPATAQLVTAFFKK